MGEQLAMLGAARPAGVPSTAVLGVDGVWRWADLSTEEPRPLYRYTLGRVWDDGPRGLLVGVNPSTADGIDDDHTARKGIGFGRRWGWGGYWLGNLYAWRATDFDDLGAAAARGLDVIGRDTDAHLARLAANADHIVVVWGRLAADRDRIAAVIALLREHARPGVALECLGYNADGSPRHPLTLAYATPREPFEVRRG